MPLLKTSREKSKKIISVGEAYNIWKMLDERYNITEHLLVLANFIHDPDFKALMDQHLNNLEKEINQLEQLTDKFSIKGPRPNKADVNVKGNSVVIDDASIAWTLFNFRVADMGLLIKAIRDSITNDMIRELFINILKNQIKAIYKYMDYMLLKGWTNVPPLYRYVPDNVDSRITTNEVYYLWDHLKFRYSNIYLTRVYSSYVYDQDLKIVFDQGINILERQRKKLESLLLKYGVILPKPYANAVPTPESTEVFTDEFMFSNILEQMKNAAALHAQSFCGTFINHEVRDLFASLVFEETNYINNLKKYGKLKGWLTIEPKYGMG